MSTPPSPARPARLAGFALIIVAVVAVGLGVFSLTSNGSSNQAGATQPPATTTTPLVTTTTVTTTSARPTTTTSTAPSTTSSAPSTTVAAPPPATTTQQQGSGSGGSGGSGGGSGGGTSAVAVRVYNNGTIPKLAASAAQDFRDDGYNVVEVGNYSQEQGVISTSTAYYSPLPGEQSTAESLGSKFGMQVKPRFPGIASASPGVIVIITNDFKGKH
jgi:hypothetical protein